MRNESRHLYSKFTAQKVTPNQIHRALYSDRSQGDETGESFEKVWQALPETLMCVFNTDSGGLNQQKIEKFMKSLELIMTNYELTDLIQLRPECIRINGSINTNKLDEILRGKYND